MKNDTYALVYTPVEEISKVIGKQGQNIRLASLVIRIRNRRLQKKQADDDVELDEFKDEIESWIIDEFKKVGLEKRRVFLIKTQEL